MLVDPIPAASNENTGTTGTEDGAAATEQQRLLDSLTDGALDRVDDDTLMDELLDRVRTALEADTAVVLLLSASGYLVATAARGVEDEVRQGFRLRLGQGFAGRVAAEKGPIRVDHVDESTVVNPVLRAKGVRVLLGVPLLVRGEVAGVLHVGRLIARPFTDDEVELLQSAAERIALTMLARRSAAERTTAVTLQRSLVPDKLLDVPGFECASRYMTAEADGVGGDWYDVFTLPSGQVCITMGDVAGRGLKAAIVMGRLRSTVRAYALDDPDPGSVLARVDRKLQHFEPGEMATVLFAVLDPATAALQLSVAGHPVPALAVPGEDPRFVDAPIDPLLGAVPPRQRRSARIDVPPGSALCFFTDGLVERRRESLDERLDILRTAVFPGAPEVVCQQVMGRLVGADPVNDDIAVLVLRRTT